MRVQPGEQYRGLHTAVGIKDTRYELVWPKARRGSLKWLLEAYF